jgi:hypothetical protein
MGYLIPAQFLVEDNRGAQTFALGQRIGRGDEIQGLVERGLHLWAYLCRRRILSHRPAAAFTTTGADTVCEGLAKIGTLRYNTSTNDLTAYVDFGGGTVAVTVYDQTFTTAYASLTSTSGTRTQVALNFTGITAQTVGVRVTLTATTPTATLYGVEVAENQIIGSDLVVSGDFVPVDESFYADGNSLNALLTRRIVNNTTQANVTRTPMGAEALDPDRPLVLTSLEEQVLERVIPLHPELRSLQVKLRYLCDEASVSVRWSVAWDGGQSEPSSWDTLTTTAGAYDLYAATVNLAPALDAGRGTARLRLHFLSAQNTGGKVYAALAVGTTLAARKVTLAAPLSSYYTTASATSGAKIELETGGGVGVDSTGDGVRQLLWWENGGGNRLYFYPPIPDAEVAELAPQVGRLAVTPLGRLQVRAWYIEYTHGTPYAGRGARFPWQDAAAARHAITSGRGPKAPSFALLYGAQEYLFQSRVPLHSWGAQPHIQPSGYAKLRGQSFAQLTYSARTTWKTLALWVVGEGDDFDQGGTIYERRAIELVAQLFCTGWHIQGFRIEARVLWESEGGTVYVTSGTQLVDLSNAPPNTYTREVFTEPDGASFPGARNLKAQGCGMPLREWGRMSYLRAQLRDLDNAHATGRVLRLQVRADQTLGEGDFGHKNGVFIYLNSAFVRPQPAQAWTQLGAG